MDLGDSPQGLFLRGPPLAGLPGIHYPDFARITWSLKSPQGGAGYPAYMRFSGFNSVMS